MIEWLRPLPSAMPGAAPSTASSPLTRFSSLIIATRPRPNSARPSPCPPDSPGPTARRLASPGFGIDTGTPLHYHQSGKEKRMVVILSEGAYGDWLTAPAEAARDFLLPYPADKLIATPMT
ncbi:hypothetical protein G6F32_016477 [Rhizopus arrhizus]|nr:hypothetical protein G6F32_016477 [Rhizopus arrhizus]